MVDLVKFYRWILSDCFKIHYFRCRKTCKKFFLKNRFLNAYCSTFKNQGSRSQKKKIFPKIDFRGAVKSPSPYYFQMFYRIGMTQLIDVRVTRCMLRCLMMNLTHMCGHRQIFIMNS